MSNTPVRLKLAEEAYLQINFEIIYLEINSLITSVIILLKDREGKCRESKNSALMSDHCQFRCFVLKQYFSSTIILRNPPQTV